MRGNAITYISGAVTVYAILSALYSETGIITAIVLAAVSLSLAMMYWWVKAIKDHIKVLHDHIKSQADTTNKQ